MGVVKTWTSPSYDLKSNKSILNKTNLSFYVLCLSSAILCNDINTCYKKISGAWDPSIRIEPPNIVPENKKHKNKAPEKFEEVNIILFKRLHNQGLPKE